MNEVSGWGRYPRVRAAMDRPQWGADVAAHLAQGKPLIARGAGRSYGDSALSERILLTASLDRFRSFDPETGELACEAGTTLDAIVRLVLSRGWFLPVTPGTRHISVGGAIASDVHGKNHHHAGTFGDYVTEIKLMLGSGDEVRCSRDEHAALFRATVGGMGLTGVILEAKLRLQRVASAGIMQTTIKLPGLDALLEAFDSEANHSYSVAWIDCASQGDALGRSLLILGEHEMEGGLVTQTRSELAVPSAWPGTTMNRTSARLLNALHYRRAPRGRSTRSIDLHRFFYPLDALADWNRLYGHQGFVQYQFVLPAEAGRQPLREILELIAHSGEASFLGVLKKFGAANANLLSFPMAGYTLALDFQANQNVFRLLDALDAVVLHHGGRHYLAKDARMSAATFRRGYPAWEEFEALRERWHAVGRFSSLQSRRLGLS